MIEGDLDAAGCEIDARGQTIEVVFVDGSKHLRLGVNEGGRGGEPAAAIFLHLGPQPFTPFSLVVDRFARGESLQVADKGGSLDDRAATVAVRGEWSENLLGAAAADLEEFFKGDAIHPGDGKLFKRFDGMRETLQPQRLVWHVGLLTLGIRQDL